MKPTIGKIYSFKYNPHFEVHEVKNPYRCKLSDEERDSLVKELTNSAEYIKSAFIVKKIDMQTYIGYLKALEREKNKRLAKGIHRKTQKEKDLEFLVKSYKEDPKKRSMTARQAARNLFIRNFDPNQIELCDDAIKAVYAGKVLSAKGKTVHRWYSLGFANIHSHYVSKEMEKYLEVCE